MDNPIGWDVDRVGAWLQGLGMGQYKASFASNKVDGKALLSLEKQELKEDLEVAALGDRKALWESIERMQARRRSSASPSSHHSSPPPPATVPSAAAPPSSSSARDATVYTSVNPVVATDRCEFCSARFAVSEVPILLTLPGERRAARLHRHCKERWSHANAKKCYHCHLPMTTDVTILTGFFGKVEVHPHCVSPFEKAAAGTTPVGTPSFPPARAASSTPPAPAPVVYAGTCEHCRLPFSAVDNPIKLTLPGATRAAELHPQCKEAWSALNAKKCDHCALAMPQDVTTLTGTFGKAEVHPHCVAAYEASLLDPGFIPHSRGGPRASPTGSPPAHRAASRSPQSGSGRCEQCRCAFTEYDEAILLTLPGAARAAELHAHCKTSWCRAHAKKCEFCREAMIQDITTLSGRWGTAELHPECVKGFENKHLSTSGTGERCAHCQRAFRDGEVASVVTLPGEVLSHKLHATCQAEWARLAAKLCEHCHTPMPTDVTTLSGAWGAADLHPDCVRAFKDSLAAGVYPSRVAQSAPSAAATAAAGGAQLRTSSPVRSDRGPLVGASSSSRCYQCRLPFQASEAVTVLSVSGMERLGSGRHAGTTHTHTHPHTDLPHDAHLHSKCVDAFHRELGHVCTWCSETIAGHMTKLKGSFGSATVCCCSVSCVFP